ncbi:hypothetical protein JCM33374_g1438 [Metschnikowia sp. JCM 33374]|nr:hypothetical protein JCM33374_g1438 [Metschnikowia sp. JCM 33374]
MKAAKITTSGGIQACQIIKESFPGLGYSYCYINSVYAEINWKYQSQAQPETDGLQFPYKPSAHFSSSCGYFVFHYFSSKAPPGNTHIIDIAGHEKNLTSQKSINIAKSKKFPVFLSMPVAPPRNSLNTRDASLFLDTSIRYTTQCGGPPNSIMYHVVED